MIPKVMIQSLTLKKKNEQMIMWNSQLVKYFSVKDVRKIFHELLRSSSLLISLYFTERDN
jgi:hypothetical protein